MADERSWRRPLAEVFEVERRGDDLFVARVGGFGGETLGCATLAAARTCEGRAVDAVHAWFLRPVPPQRPIELAVERVRDGRRFAHRRVQVRDGGRLLCELTASFAADGTGAELQDARADAAPPPEDLPDEASVMRAEGMREGEPGPLGGPLEWRFVSGVPWRIAGGGSAPSRYLAWVRPAFPLPADPGLHAAAVVFLADYHSHIPVARALGGEFEPWGYTSLDQSVWLHRDLAWDDWRLVVSEADVAYAGRALSRRMLFTRDGRLVASMAQEALIPAPPRQG